MCARCSGLYAAVPIVFLLGLIVGSGWIRTRQTDSNLWRVVLLVSAMPTLLTVGGELSGGVQLSGLTRAVAAAPLGFGVTWLVGLALHGDIH